MAMLFDLPPFEYIDAVTIEDAISSLQNTGRRAKVIAGGSDLLGLIKDKIRGPEMGIPEILVNIKNIPGIRLIAQDREGNVRIGAAVTLNDLENDAVLRAKYPIISQAAHQVGTTQIRNVATLGGNLCQRPRCMYFRHPHFVCFKKGGSRCFAIAGEHRDYHSIMNYGKCVMAHPSDMATALIALKSKAIVAGPGGEKEVPLEEFFLDAGRTEETLLSPCEILKEIRIPQQMANINQCFIKHRTRHAVDFALSSVAATARILDAFCEESVIVLGGISPYPYVATGREDFLRGKRLNGEAIAQAAEKALEGAHPLRQNHYKLELTKALLRRALTSICEKEAETWNQEDSGN